MPRSTSPGATRRRLQRKRAQHALSVDIDESATEEIVESGCPLESDHSDPISAPFVSKLDRILTKMCYSQARISSFPSRPELDQISGPDLDQLRIDCRQAYAEILQRMSNVGMSLWDARCATLLLRVSEPELFCSEMSYQIQVSEYGWITRIVLQPTGLPIVDLGTTNLEVLGWIFKNYGNELISNQSKMASPPFPSISKEVRYLETYFRASGTKDFSDQGILFLAGKIGLRLNVNSIKLLRERSVLRVKIVQKHRKSVEREIRKAFEFAQITCGVVDRDGSLSQSTMIKRMAHVYRMLYPKICAALCHNILALACPVMYYDRTTGKKMLMIGQHHSPVFYVRIEQSVHSTHTMITINPNDPRFWYIVYGKARTALAPQEYRSALFCEQAIQTMNIILNDADLIFAKTLESMTNLF